VQTGGVAGKLISSHTCAALGSPTPVPLYRRKEFLFSLISCRQDRHSSEQTHDSWKEKNVCARSLFFLSSESLFSFFSSRSGKIK